MPGKAVVIRPPRSGLAPAPPEPPPKPEPQNFLTAEKQAAAEARKAQVEAFWAGEMGAEAREVFLQRNKVGYVLAGSELGGLETGD